MFKNEGSRIPPVTEKVKSGAWGALAIAALLGATAWSAYHLHPKKEESGVTYKGQEWLDILNSGRGTTYKRSTPVPESSPDDTKSRFGLRDA